MVLRLSGRPCARSEDGQAMVLFVVVLTALLLVAALVFDISDAYLNRHSLQASADAAALAGARELPDVASAVAVAGGYSGQPGAKNAAAKLAAVTANITTKCVSIAPCKPVNAVVVDQSAVVQTTFSRIFGIGTITVHAHAVACAPCQPKKVDIMLVLDRTGSMCMDHSGWPDPACTDLNNARNGIHTFLSFLDPSFDRVGLVVLPPAPRTGSMCSAADKEEYDDPRSRWLLSPLTSDFGDSSTLVHTLDCLAGWGRTSYATALEKADAELRAHGRDDADHVIIFLSDGAANYGPDYYDDGSTYRMQPCHQGVNSAGAAKSDGIEIYSIGYDLNAEDGGANQCMSSFFHLEWPSISAYSALQQISSGDDYFYNKPNPGQLNTIYTNVAVKVLGPRLIE